jgi:hypothetical protein
MNPKYANDKMMRKSAKWLISEVTAGKTIDSVKTDKGKRLSISEGRKPRECRTIQRTTLGSQRQAHVEAHNFVKHRS